MSTGLNDKQYRMLKFIHKHEAEHGFPPTIREIGRALDIASTSGVTSHIKTLIERGYLTQLPGKARTVILTDRGLAIVSPESEAVQSITQRRVLQAENHMLRAELERLKHEHLLEINALWRQIASLQQELIHSQRAHGT